MKTEQLIVQYLYRNKKVSLQDIGTFTISPEVNIPTENDKDTPLPPDSIQFTWDQKAAVDEGLINYIMEHTRKIRPLATSDLESYIMLNTQFLNIGKPLILEGLGTLQKAQSGEYAFTQAGTSHAVYEESPKLVTEKQKEQVSFKTLPRETSSGSGSAALWIIVILLLAAGGFAAWYFMNEKNASAENSIAAVTNDSTDLAEIDTISAKKIHDSLTNVKATPDSNSFYVVINTFNDLGAANKSLKKLTSYGNKVILHTNDSVTYTIRMPFMLPLSDTLRVKDSLAKFFGARTFVQLP